MIQRASRRRIIRPPKIEKVKPISKIARYDSIDHEPRNQFEALRRSLQLPQDQFAEKCGINKQCVHHYETNRSFPTMKKWNAMKENAAKHGITLNDEIFNEFMTKKLEKKMAMLERHHQEKLEQINSKFNTKMNLYHQEIHGEV